MVALTLVLCVASCALFDTAHARGAVLVKGGNTALSNEHGFYGSIISHEHTFSSPSKSKLPRSVSLKTLKAVKGLMNGGPIVSSENSQLDEVLVAKYAEDAGKQLHALALSGNVFAMLEYSALLRSQLEGKTTSFEEAKVFSYLFVGCVRLYAMLRSSAFDPAGELDVDMLTHEIPTFVAPVFKHYQKAAGFLFDSPEAAAPVWAALSAGNVLEQVKELHEQATLRDAREIFAGARNEKVLPTVEIKIERLGEHLAYSEAEGSSPEFVRLANSQLE